jgi:hypothetical protein
MRSLDTQVPAPGFAGDCSGRPRMLRPHPVRFWTGRPGLQWGGADFLHIDQATALVLRRERFSLGSGRHSLVDRRWRDRM